MICKNKKCRSEIPDNSAYCLYCGASQASKQQNAKSRGNGTGSVYKLPNGKYKAIVTLYYYIKDGRLRRKTASKTFSRRVDAINALPGLKTQGERRDVTLQGLYDLFVTTPKYLKLSKSQKDKLGYAWTRLAPLHRKKISEITVDDMQNTIDSAVKTYYPARDMKVMLSHLYELAKKREFCTYNKTENIDLPELEKSKRDAFTDLEVQKFWLDFEGRGEEAEAHPFTGYILIMIYTGMRYGELAKVSLEDIHLKEQYLIGGIKTDAGIDRRIPLSSKILSVVSDLSQDRRHRLLEMNEDNFYATYWETIERLGIRRLPPQCCRHTYFTRLADAGVPAAVIAEAGGHSDIQTTFDHYIHTPLSVLVEAVEKI